MNREEWKTNVNVLGTDLVMMMTKNRGIDGFDIFLMNSKFRFVLRMTTDIHMMLFRRMFFSKRSLPRFEFAFFTSPTKTKDFQFDECQDGTKRRRIEDLHVSDDLYLIVTESLKRDTFHCSRKSYQFLFQSCPLLPSTILPDEVIVLILKFLDPRYLLTKVNLVNKRFRMLVECEKMYKHHHSKHLLTKSTKVEYYPKGKPRFKNWKDYVREIMEKYKESLKNTNVESNRFNRIELVVSEKDRPNVNFKLRRCTPLRRLMTLYCKMTSRCTTSLTFHFYGSIVGGDQTPDELQMTDGDEIYVLIKQVGGKPVVLLYSPHPNFKVECVNVRLHHEFWRLQCHYPLTKVSDDESTTSMTSVQWNNLVVQPNGKIEFEKNKYEYLFWESVTNDSNIDFDEETTIYFISSNNVVDFLRKKLEKLGLPEKEIHCMVQFWLRDLMSKPFNLIQFMSTSNYERMVDLEVQPTPEETLKIFMLFAGVDMWEDVDDAKRKNVKRFEGSDGHDEERRRLAFGEKFVAIEWGGMNLICSSFVKN